MVCLHVLSEEQLLSVNSRLGNKRELAVDFGVKTAGETSPEVAGEPWLTGGITEGPSVLGVICEGCGVLHLDGFRVNVF